MCKVYVVIATCARKIKPQAECTKCKQEKKKVLIVEAYSLCVVLYNGSNTHERRSFDFCTLLLGFRQALVFYYHINEEYLTEEKKKTGGNVMGWEKDGSPSNLETLTNIGYCTIIVQEQHQASRMMKEERVSHCNCTIELKCLNNNNNILKLQTLLNIDFPFFFWLLDDSLLINFVQP
ncbi:hypothetical protein BD560DRAFT_486020 [Blakeslea trispora]|nr:hypothetical protein BD560DRAFT_486020 [Blakeslea trispora]